MILRRARKAKARHRTASGLGKYDEPQMLPPELSKRISEVAAANDKANMVH